MSITHEHQQTVWTIHDVGVLKSERFNLGKTSTVKTTYPTKAIVSLPQWREDGEMGFRQAVITQAAIERVFMDGILLGLSPRKPRVSGDNWVGFIFKIEEALRAYLMSFPNPVNSTANLGIKYFFGFVKDPIPVPVDGQWYIDDTLCAIDICLEDLPNGLYLPQWESLLLEKRE